MKILIVKMTSMGDVLHVLPALTDLANSCAADQELQVDWMVEAAFAQIPLWHPAVKRVIPVSTRRWRRLKWRYVREFFDFLRTLRTERYDYIIDAQGLIKSAVFSRFARLSSGGVRAGYSGRSIKESPAAWFYGRTIEVERNQHAVDRLRQLVSQVVGYALTSERGDYGLTLPRLHDDLNGEGVSDRVVAERASSAAQGLGDIFLFHGTTWLTKHVPDLLWAEVINVVIAQGYRVKLCWGNEIEKTRAKALAKGLSAVTVLPKSSLLELAHELSNAVGAVAVDTGLGHLAAALDVPCVSLYGATDPLLTGTYGNYQSHLQAEYWCAPCLLKHCTELAYGQYDPPCYATFSAAMIWHSLARQIRSRQTALGV